MIWRRIIAAIRRPAVPARGDGLVEVYVIGQIKDGFAISPCKIGIANDARSRLSTFQTSCPFKIDVVAAFILPDRETAWRVESCCHKILRPSLGTHGEWFDLCPLAATAIVATLIDELLRASNISNELYAMAASASGVTQVLDLWNELTLARRGTK